MPAIFGNLDDAAAEHAMNVLRHSDQACGVAAGAKEIATMSEMSLGDDAKGSFGMGDFVPFQDRSIPGAKEVIETIKARRSNSRSI